jgi:hypothetical protein
VVTIALCSFDIFNGRGTQAQFTSLPLSFAMKGVSFPLLTAPQLAGLCASQLPSGTSDKCLFGLAAGLKWILHGFSFRI